MDTLNIGIIGAGGIAQKLHLPDIARTPGLRVTALAGRKESRLRSLAERFDVPRITTDAQAILTDELGITVEGAAAAAWAGLEAIPRPDGPVLLIITGSNT